MADKLPTFNSTLKTSEKIELVSNLATMLTAGIPILDAVNSILEDTKGAQRKILETLREDLGQGKQVYISFAKFPRCFDQVTVNLIRAAEEAGTLEVTLKDLRDHIQSDAEFTDKIKFALIYPALIVCLFFGLLIVMLVFVIPKITQVFTRLKVPLPLPTKILMFISDLLLKQTFWFLGGIALVLLIIYLLFKTQKRYFMEFIYRLPVVSTLVRQIDLARFSRSLYLLLSSGLPIATALELSKDVVLRTQTSAIIVKSRQMIMDGKRFSDGLKTGHKVIPSLMIKLVEAGEKSGQLEQSMHDISNTLDYQVGNTLKAFTALMEPVMLILVSLSVGGMMISIIAPIYGIISQVGGR